MRNSLNVKYVGPMSDYSGYSEANRNYVRALQKAGVNVTTQIFSYSNNQINMFGESFRTVKSLENKDIKYDIKVVHVPCDSYLKHLEPGKYHIGHLFWETDRMDPAWVWNCNLMDEIWTGSSSNKKAFEKSGVKIPIFVFPQAIDVGFAKKRKKWKIKGVNKKTFLFFSVFQWIERKNPKTLIEAYLKEFKKSDNVGLLIKTYKEKFTKNERREIFNEIAAWKQNIGLDEAPPIYLNVEFMDKEDVWRIYETGDCFVLPHRGEGWGIPTVEALLFGKPVIATQAGGVYDWLTKECYYPLASREVKVKGMEWAPWYKSNQRWREINVGEVRTAMRQVYKNREEAKQKGKMGRFFVKENFSFDGVGRMLRARLEEIQDHIDASKKQGVGSWV